jgi:competence protein ComEC
MWGQFREYFQKNWQNEGERIYLWLPLFMALGIGSYFILPTANWGIFSGAGGAISLWLFLKKRNFSLLLLVFYFLGLLAMLGKIWRTDPHILTYDFVGDIQGKVESVERRPANLRLVLNQLRGENLPPLTKIRVTLNYGQDSYPKVGDEIYAKIKLFAASSQVAPSAINLYENLFFKNLSASGYVQKLYEVQDRGEALGMRTQIARNIRHNLPKESGSVAVALITGENAVKNSLQEDYRASGIIHLLSISGAHMSLLAGLIFLFLRALFARIEYLSLRYDSKKISAAVTILISAVYLYISGADIPALRAFMITSIVLLGIIFSRSVLNLRSLSLVAILILMVVPQSIFSASFQMSFLAVLLIMNIYLKLGKFLPRNEDDFLTMVGKFLGFSVLISCLANLVILPTLLYYFNKISLLGFVSNILAEPVFSLWVMPALAASVFLMSFTNLYIIPLKVSGFGIEILNNIAQITADIPLMQMEFRLVPTWAFLGMLGGIIWWLIWSQKWRYWGLGFFGIFLMFAFFYKNYPDVIISPNRDLIGLANASGRLYIIGNKKEKFIRSIWEQKYGLENETNNLKGKFACEENKYCKYEIAGQSLVINYDEKIFDGTCSQNTIYVQDGKVECLEGYKENPNLIKGSLLLWVENSQVKWQDLSSKNLK